MMEIVGTAHLQTHSRMVQSEANILAWEGAGIHGEGAVGERSVCVGVGSNRHHGIVARVMHHSRVGNGKLISWEPTGRRIRVLVTQRRKTDDGDGAVVLLNIEHSNRGSARALYAWEGSRDCSCWVGAVRYWSSTADFSVNIPWIQTI